MVVVQAVATVAATAKAVMEVDRAAERVVGVMEVDGVAVRAVVMVVVETAVVVTVEVARVRVAVARARAEEVARVTGVGAVGATAKVAREAEVMDELARSTACIRNPSSQTQRTYIVCRAWHT